MGWAFFKLPELGADGAGVVEKAESSLCGRKDRQTDVPLLLPTRYSEAEMWLKLVSVLANGLRCHLSSTEL